MKQLQTWTVIGALIVSMGILFFHSTLPTTNKMLDHAQAGKEVMNVSFSSPRIFLRNSY